MRRRYYYIDILRWVLMIFVCVNTFSFPGQLGAYLKIISGFAYICFFIISGFLVLRHNHHIEQKIKAAIRRTGIMALTLFFFYLLFNIVYLALRKQSFLEVMKAFMTSKRMIFQFVALNAWFLPIGDTFWFIQCLLYGYVAIYILKKLDLLKYDYIICLICLIIAVLTGELANIIHFNFLGYTYIPSTVITRSLPYLLIGRIIGRNRKYFVEHRMKISLTFIPVSVWLTVVEIQALSKSNNLIYTGHMIGNGLLACVLCGYVIMREDWGQQPMYKDNYLISNARHYVKYVYAFHQICGIIYLLMIRNLLSRYYYYLAPLVSIVAFITSLLIGIVVRGCVDSMRFEEDEENEVKISV